MAFFDKLLGRGIEDDFDEFDDSYDNYQEEEPEILKKPVPQKSRRASGKVVNFRQSETARPSQHEVMVVQPADMEAMWKICDYVVDGKTVICNIEGVAPVYRQRLVDFVTGASYAIGGEIKPISQLIFVFAPSSTMISMSGAEEDMSVRERLALDDYDYGEEGYSARHAGGV